MTLLALGGVTVFLLIGSRSLHGRAEPAYFPELVFHREPERNQFLVDWYSKHLRAMREPSIWGLAQGDRGTTAYRLLWLPSFHHPACIRVTRSGQAATLRVVVLDGLGGYEPGQIAIDRTIHLAESDWREIERQFDRLKFWSLPTKLEDDLGNDGDQLILEGCSPGRYHITDRWEPDFDYLRTCLSLADLSGVRLRKELMNYHSEGTQK